MALFEYSPESLLADIPTMYAFPHLNDVYSTWKEHLEKRGARVRLNSEVLSVKDRRASPEGVILCYKQNDASRNQDAVEIENFDELILAVDADSCLKILGNQASDGLHQIISLGFETGSWPPYVDRMVVPDRFVLANSIARCSRAGRACASNVPQLETGQCTCGTNGFPFRPRTLSEFAIVSSAQFVRLCSGEKGEKRSIVRCTLQPPTTIDGRHKATGLRHSR